MVTWIYALAVSTNPRVQAVHREFAEKSNSEALNVLLCLALGVLAIFCILAAMNRLQQRKQDRQSAAHRAEVRAKVRRVLHHSR